MLRAHVLAPYADAKEEPPTSQSTAAAAAVRNISFYTFIVPRWTGSRGFPATNWIKGSRRANALAVGRSVGVYVAMSRGKWKPDAMFHTLRPAAHTSLATCSQHGVALQIRKVCCVYVHRTSS